MAEGRVRKAARSAGKRTERRWAALLGGKRIPSPGRASRDMDVVYPLCVEMKHRKEKMPQWVRDGLAQAEADALPNEIPIYIRHDKGDHWSNDVVMMTGRSFMRILRTVGVKVRWADGEDE